jgi:hypothetical protein
LHASAQQEFFEGFVLEAYTAKCESFDTKEEYGMQLELWVRRFNEGIEQNLFELSALIQNSATTR